MATAKRAYGSTHLPGLLLPASLAPRQPTANPYVHRRRIDRSGSASCRVTYPFPWVLVHTRFCLCPLRAESLFPPILCKSCNQVLLAFKVKSPGDSQSLCWIPRLESLVWGLEPSQQCKNFFGITVLQFVGCPPSSYGNWFYHDCMPPIISLPFLLWPWTWDVFFFLCSSALLPLIVQ